MKHLALMSVLTLIGTLGVVVDPFLGVAVYYLYAVLRPQYLWEWSLPVGVPWSSYVALATLGAAALQLLSTGAANGSGPRLNRIHAAILLFAAWVGVSYITARDQEVAYPWLIEYLKIFVMIFASAMLVRKGRHVWLLFCLTGLALGYAALDINHLYLTTGYLGIYHNGYAGLDNNGAGLMFAMGVPICYFAWEGCRGKLRWAFLALVPVILHVVLLTYSRGAMVSLLAAAPLIGLRSRNRKRVALCGLVLLSLLPVLAGAEIRARFFSVSDHERDESMQCRRASWAAAWAITQENPVFGVGIRNANLLSHQYGADMEGRTIHNQYLQIAADNGLVGLAFYVTAFALTGLGLIRVRRRAWDYTGPASERVLAMTAGIECALAVFAIGSLFLSLEVFELPYLMFLLAAQLCVLCDRVGVPARVRVSPAVRPSLA